MSILDVVVAVAAVLAGIAGWRLGLLTRAASWLGMALGLLVAARALPWLIDRLGSADGDGLVLLAVGLLVCGALAGQAAGLLVGNRLNVALKNPTSVAVDRVGGVFAGVAGVLIVVWLVAPALADRPGWQSRLVRQSEVARAVNRWFPDPPDATESLRQLVGEDYPQVFDAFQRAPEVGPPPAASGLDTATARRVARSTVKVVGEACDRVQEGSGFVAAPGLVVTNAHVVAGEPSTVIERSDGSQVEGEVVAFDPARDLAVVSVPDIDRPALRLQPAEVGDRGAVFGHPGGGDLELSPFEVGERIAATGTDIYGDARTQRSVLVLAADLAPGDSGSALVDPDGTVIGVAFAIAPDRDGVAYALDTSELTPVLRAARAGRQPVGTGRCTS